MGPNRKADEAVVTDDDAASAQDAQDWRAACEESIAALTEALGWHLPEPRWKQVEEALADLAMAVAAGRPQALWQAAGLLELCSPLRATTRLGDTPQLPAPKAAQEQIVDMIDTLTAAGVPKTSGREADQGSGLGSETATSVLQLDSTLGRQTRVL